MSCENCGHLFITDPCWNCGHYNYPIPVKEGQTRLRDFGLKMPIDKKGKVGKDGKRI